MEFFNYSHKSSTLSFVSEMLMVTIIEAEDIPVRDLSGYAYSFVVAKGKKTEEKHKGKGVQVEYKTKLVRAGFWPTFNDTIEFVVEREDLDNEVLDLYLYEMNRWTKHDGIGQVSIELKNLDLSIGKEHILKRKLKPYDPFADMVSDCFLSRIRGIYELVVQITSPYVCTER